MCEPAEYANTESVWVSGVNLITTCMSVYFNEYFIKGKGCFWVRDSSVTSGNWHFRRWGVKNAKTCCEEENSGIITHNYKCWFTIVLEHRTQYTVKLFVFFLFRDFSFTNQELMHKPDLHFLWWVALLHNGVSNKCIVCSSRVGFCDLCTEQSWLQIQLYVTQFPLPAEHWLRQKFNML